MGFQLRAVFLSTLLHNWKSSVPVQHFKLKLKDLWIYLYCLASAQCVSFLRSNPSFKYCETGAWKLEYTRLCLNENFQFTQRLHLPKEFISYQRADNC